MVEERRVNTGTGVAGYAELRAGWVVSASGSW